jgi:two-component system response regulator DevR
MSNKIKVMIVEDDEFWRSQLWMDLRQEPDLEVVKMVSTKEDAIEAANSIHLHIILMDLNLTENHLDGLEAAKNILRTGKSSARIIMLTSFNDNRVIMDSFQIGAVNYVTKSSYHDIVNAIRQAYNGQSSIHSDAATVLRSEIQLMALSPMEREVYELKTQGMNKTQISQKLNKSFNTVKSQLKSIREKLTYDKWGKGG